MPGPLRRVMPRTFQGRLTLGFISVVSLTLLLVGPARDPPPRRLLPRPGAAEPRGPGRLDRRRSSSWSPSSRSTVRSSTSDDQLTARPPRRSSARSTMQRDRRRRRPGRSSTIEVGHAGRRTSTATARSCPAPNGQFAAMSAQRRPKRGQARESLTPPAVTDGRSRERRDSQWAIEVALSNPYTYRASTLTAGHRPVRRRRDHRLHRVGRRGGLPGPPVHDPAPAADDGRPRPRAGRARQPRPDPAGRRPARSRSPSCRASSTRWPTGSRRASRSSGATATGAATSWPTCRTSCAPRSPRCGRRTSSSARPPATTRTTRAEFLEIEPPAARAARLAGPEPARALEARLGARPARPAAGRPPGRRRVGGRAGRSDRRAARRGAQPEPPAEPGPDPPRPAAHRPGRDEPRRQRPQVHARGAGR